MTRRRRNIFYANELALLRTGTVSGTAVATYSAVQVGGSRASSPASIDIMQKENVMAKYLMMLAVLGAFISVNLGCEAKVDDDGAKVDIDGD